MRISLCLIVWNEIDGCKLDLPNLDLNEFEEIYAVDGGSSDGTKEYLESLGIKVHKQKIKSLNAAYIEANEIAKNDYVVVFFPKGTIPVNDLKQFRKYFQSGYDLVIASRQIKGSRNEEDAHLLKPRKWAVMLLGFMAALVWKKEGNTIFDVLHGVKGWKKDAFNSMEIINQGVSIDIEMVVRSYKKKIKRIEFPTNESKRLHGETKFGFWATGWKLLKYLSFELNRK